ncbi:unnamed protein product [Durusdinium trenchii]|uniref:Transmembrane protein n=2 Tax=Durusdinium trenchii TaxID=1381693 RepID=A0ABP0R506_9DINO|eukprot:g20516.t1
MVLCVHNRPILERFRVLCTICLVFDAIFMLIFALSGLSASAYSAETKCYEENGYSWHNILALSFIVSAVFAAWGVLLHGAVVISGEGAPLKSVQLTGVSRYGHILVAWTFLAAVLEAIASRQQPLECSGEMQGVLAEPALGDVDSQALTRAHVSALWQMVSTVMWLIWVVAAVAAAMSSKRCMLALEEAQVSQRQDSEAQMVGVPVQEELPSGTVVGVATPSLQGDVPSQPTFQGMPVAVADGVCQGMPVRDEAGNMSHPPTGIPKQV